MDFLILVGFNSLGRPISCKNRRFSWSLKCNLYFAGQIAPDTVFLDLEDRLRIGNETIKRGGLIGRGAFGFVYEGVCRPRGQTGPKNVALKMLQPISPGVNADEGTVAAFDAAKAKWDRDPQQYASKAYCTARQELR